MQSIDVVQRKKTQNKLFELVKQVDGVQTIVSRHLTETEVELDHHDRTAPMMVDGWGVPGDLICYPCMKPLKVSHPVYAYSCMDCTVRRPNCGLW